MGGTFLDLSGYPSCEATWGVKTSPGRFGDGLTLSQDTAILLAVYTLGKAKWWWFMTCASDQPLLKRHMSHRPYVPGQPLSGIPPFMTCLDTRLHVSQVNLSSQPYASGQPLPGCEARLGYSVPPKLYSWPSFATWWRIGHPTPPQRGGVANSPRTLLIRLAGKNKPRAGPRGQGWYTQKKFAKRISVH